MHSQREIIIKKITSSEKQVVKKKHYVGVKKKKTIDLQPKIFYGQ